MNVASGLVSRCQNRVESVVAVSSCGTCASADGSTRRAVGAFSDGAAAGSGPCSEEVVVSKGSSVVILGIILIIVGLLVASLKVLLWVGIVLLVVGLIVNAVPIGGRRRRVF